MEDPGRTPADTIARPVPVRTELTESDWRLVPLVIRARKKLGAAIDEVGRVIRNKVKAPEREHGNPGDWHFIHEVPVANAQMIPVKLRLCVPYRCSIPLAWTCSLIMFNTKIDGVDFHVRASDGRGGICRGWHRHEWDAARRLCDHLRNPLPDFDPGDTIEVFLENCCGVMNIDVRNEDATQ